MQASEQFVRQHFELVGVEVQRLEIAQSVESSDGKLSEFAVFEFEVGETFEGVEGSLDDDVQRIVVHVEDLQTSEASEHERKHRGNLVIAEVQFSEVVQVEEYFGLQVSDPVETETQSVQGHQA